MHLKSIELSGFKSFAKKETLAFTSPIAAIVGPNGSGKSNAAEAFRFVLGEQSMKAMRGKRGPDLIWTGNERTPRANRARVAVTFNNADRLLDIDFDEVVVERIVHRDGAHEYAINGSTVRLKDIAALLASANIGASGHHIISQGEADRILGASERERREMVEEALGLKTYQYQKAESEKKLAKTAENMKDVASLRRELAPHLAFLERQMKKLERSRELRTQLEDAVMTFVHGERRRIHDERARIAQEQQRVTNERARVIQQLNTHEAQKEHAPDTSKARAALDERLATLAKERGTLEHALGRIEGQLALLAQPQKSGGTQERAVPFVRVTALLTEIDDVLASMDSARMAAMRERISAFVREHQDTAAQHDDAYDDSTDTVSSLERERAHIKKELAELVREEEALARERAKAHEDTRAHEERSREAQRAYYERKDTARTLERQLGDLEHALGQLRFLEQRASELQQDSGISVPEGMASTAPSREAQEHAHKELTKLQARLDEAGHVDDDTVHEYEETKKRDAFLAHELADLEASRNSLNAVIANLDDELGKRFSEGLKRINTEFQNFFAMLFDGGHASLELLERERKQGGEADDEREAKEAKEGIDIRVQLPRKKVTTLDVLSGGERALTSIALIFAMSQVNPPPFIILDETDAALDEANSRKYADMVQRLSERSQLILITHNRQTMEAAGELYGVTMGADGVSKLLSVKFDEAVSVAK